VHGAAAGRAVAGQRTAVNLAGIEPADLTRGDVLSEPRRFGAVEQVDCRLQLLPSAKPLKHRAPVHFHAGTAETEAEVRLFRASTLAPGASTCARLVLHRPALLLPGDRFIIRMFSPVVTIGGGMVLDIGEHRYSRRDDPIARLEGLEAGNARHRVATLVRESPSGIGMAGLVALTGFTEPEIDVAAAKAQLVAIPQPHPWYVDRTWFESARQQVIRTVRQFHSDKPLLPGIAKSDLAAGMAPFIVDALLNTPELAVDGETVRLRTHRVVLKEDEEQARGAIERAFEQAGLAVPAVAEVLAKSGVEPARARTLMQILLRDQRLVRIGDDLVFHHSALHQLRRMLAGRKSARFNVPVFKEWTGISRKYAIPLLEYLDREHVTRREGNERVVI
jgi:selenocysteine-specific elongation factor